MRPVSELPELDSWDIARYSRHLILDEVGVEGQRRLKGAAVLCVGTWLVGMFHDLLNIPGAAESFLAGVRAGLASGGLLVVQDQLAATTAGAGAWGPGFTLIHHLMGQRLFTEAECVAAFSAAGFRLLRRLATDIPDNWIFLLQAE
jgi:hypothetical protein